MQGACLENIFKGSQERGVDLKIELKHFYFLKTESL